jgi:hypothetical protein
MYWRRESVTAGGSYERKRRTNIVSKISSSAQKNRESIQSLGVVGAEAGIVLGESHSTLMFRAIPASKLGVAV